MYKTHQKEKFESLFDRGDTENESCVFIDKWLQRVSGHCASLYHPNNSISLRESFRFQTTPTGCGFRQICQAFSRVAAKHRIIHCLPALSLVSLSSSPSYFSPLVE